MSRKVEGWVQFSPLSLPLHTSLTLPVPLNDLNVLSHVAHQQHTFFVDWPQGKESDPRYRGFGIDSPASQPPFAEAMVLWRASCDEADVWLHATTKESLQRPFTSPLGENGGTLIVRNIFHTWCHLGEISSIRQTLGHRPPEFVEMYKWFYDGT